MADPNDLLSMQEPGLPSFLDMARASAPVMQPSSPSPFAGIMYGRDKMRHDDLLEKAAYMANLRKQLDEQRMSEFQAAAPGRMSEINLKNQLAGADLGDASTLIDARHATNQSALEEAKAKGAEAQTKLLKSYGVDGWDEANEATKRLIFNKAQDSHAAFANGMSFEDFDNYMSHIGTARKNEPTIYGRIEAANKRLEGSQAMAKSRVDVANIQATSRQWIEKNKPQNMSMSQWEASVRGKITNNTATTEDYDALQHLVMEREHNALIRASSVPGQFAIPGLPPRIPPNIPPAPIQEAPPGTPTRGAPAGGPPANPLPPKAIIQLTAAGPGKPVTFTNGQVWMIDPQTHQPRRLDGGK